MSSICLQLCPHRLFNIYPDYLQKFEYYVSSISKVCFQYFYAGFPVFVLSMFIVSLLSPAFVVSASIVCPLGSGKFRQACFTIHVKAVKLLFKALSYELIKQINILTRQ